MTLTVGLLINPNVNNFLSTFGQFFDTILTMKTNHGELAAVLTILIIFVAVPALAIVGIITEEIIKWIF